ncbi:MAG: ATP-binding cassette domain-containing protein, partial [Rubrivivax sp.]|nr:ATP-binding cassette domain-containing protein [Rubrivivax sp.]
MQAATATAGPPAVAMRHIDKRFGAVHANRDVHLTVAPGTVHGIVGENGAGKSTLMSILYGFYQADSGEILVEGQPAHITGSREAIALGIGMVHQHFMLVDTLSALDNVMLGAEPGWRLNRARAEVRAKLDVLMRDTGLHVDLDTLVQDLPVGERQRLEILKALYRGARILILDEPTAVLTPQETEHLFVTLRGLRARGTTILLITHKLKEIMALCDAVTVMRGGQVVLDANIADTSVDGLAEAMVGRRVNLGRDGKAAQAGAVLLQAQGLNWTDGLGVQRLADVSLSLRAGEIVGIAGVSGNGQSELLDVLSGLLAPDAGTLQV